MCDSCVKVECHQCVEVPSEFHTLITHPEVKFLCVACHWKDDASNSCITPYQVSIFLAHL